MLLYIEVRNYGSRIGVQLVDGLQDGREEILVNILQLRRVTLFHDRVDGVN